MVFGVASDDVFNLRAGPGIGAPILVGLEPTDNDVIALGNTRQPPSSFWYEVEAGGATGWTSGWFLFYEGIVDDLTSLVVERLGGTIPTPDTMEALGLIVAEALAGLAGSRIRPTQRGWLQLQPQERRGHRDMRPRRRPRWTVPVSRDLASRDNDNHGVGV